ncbi:hypothetical protein BDR07DRAFT_1408910 [Suillus spraguei]|nr:hypothetical protein BDR07DRAFT_1408910 [Suillus spraguei]
MVSYCGCLMRDEWLFQRCVELGYPYPVTAEDMMDMIIALSTHVMIKARVYHYQISSRESLQGDQVLVHCFRCERPYLYCKGSIVSLVTCDIPSNTRTSGTLAGVSYSFTGLRNRRPARCPGCLINPPSSSPSFSTIE